MERSKSVLDLIGREPGCQRLAQDFYARVAQNSVLTPLFPGKSLRCAAEEFAAFLIQLLDGDEDKTQYRWWLSIRESHARFKISNSQRTAWLGLMNQTILSLPLDTDSQRELLQFFRIASVYIVGGREDNVEQAELNQRWENQKTLDNLVSHIKTNCDSEAIELARQFSSRPSVFVGILARMMDTGRAPLVQFVVENLQKSNSLATVRFNGRSLLHHAAGSGCEPVVREILANRVEPNLLDSGGHTPLYRAAGVRGSAEVVRDLVRAGAEVDHCGGVNKSTALHQAARFGNLSVAKALIDSKANIQARDKKGLTPLDRANNCRKHDVAALLAPRK